MSMVSEDRPVLEALQAYLGAGTIDDRGVRRHGWKPESRLTIASESTHLRSTIPFADRFLPPCHKRSQFLAWRDELLAYRRRRETVFARGRSVCSRPECDAPVRGQGLCRRHYYELTGW
jgi:hypothetical protein